MSDDAIEVLKAGDFNHRLLSEMICHKNFQTLMLDAEIYVDRIADMRIHDMNAVLEAVRQMTLAKYKGEEEDLYSRTLAVAQVQDTAFDCQRLRGDMMHSRRQLNSNFIINAKMRNIDVDSDPIQGYTIIASFDKI